MCRNIRVLHHFEPPTTEEEMRAAALQYVRKVSGAAAAARGAGAGAEAFARAVDEVTAATQKLLAELPARGEPRTREGEKERAKARWKLRAARSGGAV
ncbi:MAG: DUF2277 domain-containing protein [Polyangiaceae bacterium]|nr:DUF2277 domain-containing protein [Polyangiaceae bacterium]